VKDLGPPSTRLNSGVTLMDNLIFVNKKHWPAPLFFCPCDNVLDSLELGAPMRKIRANWRFFSKKDLRLGIGVLIFVNKKHIIRGK
jgi:hypothetical protein